MAEPCFIIHTDMSTPLKTQLDGNTMTTLAEHRTSIDRCDVGIDGRVIATDGQTMITVGQFKMVYIEDTTVATAHEETTMVEVDPLMCSLSASVSAHETVQSESTAPPASTVPVSPPIPGEDFMSATDGTPNITRRGHEGSEMKEAGAGDIDMDEVVGTRMGTRGKRIAGRKLPVVDDDSETQTSMSIASAEEDDSKASSSSSRPKRKGVKRGREREVEKDQKKEGKIEERGNEERKKRRAKGIESGRKDAPEDEEAEGKCGEPKGVVEHVFEDMSSSVLGGAILEWANKIDDIRLKSKNFQSRLSGEMKMCVGKIKEGTALLVIRSEATGDPDFLRMRNSELAARLRETERENARLKEQLKKTSPLPSPPRKRRIEKAVEAANAAAKVVPGVLTLPVGARKAPPLIGEAFPPLPQRPPRNLTLRSGDDRTPSLLRAPPSSAAYDTEDSGTGTEAFFNQRIKLLIAACDLEKNRKSRERQGREQAGIWDERREKERVDEDKGRDGTRRMGPRIVDNVQVVPSFSDRFKERAITPGISGPEPEWRLVTRGRRGRRNKYDGLPPPPPSFLPPPHTPRMDHRAVVQDMMREPLAFVANGAPPGQQPKIRPPRPPVSSAVTITGRAEGFSYANALKKARERIDLETLGIRTSRIRKAVNGGLLIEVTGEDSKAKAEELVSRLRDVLKDSAAITCPVKKRELRVVGFDESVTIGELSEALSSLGGCSLADIKTGSIRTMTNGLGVVWVQLPVVAAAKVMEAGRVRIGWTVARVELLKVRPLQCYRCWTFVHVQNMCHSVVDRRGACFKCGQHGHMASVCKNPAHCAVCHDAGLEASHRLGGPQCAAQVRQDALLSERRP